MLKVVSKSNNFGRAIYIYIYIACAVFLASLLTFTAYHSSAHAVNPQTVDYSVTIKPTLNISVSSNPIVINLDPSIKQFDKANLNIGVGTNNQYGYKLYVNTDNNTTNLVKSDDNTITMPTLSSTTTEANFPVSKWGYRINNDVGGDSSVIDTTSTNYYQFTPGTLVSSSTTATNEKVANLTFGAKIDYTQPAGLYELTLKFKAIPTVTTYYMQDIAADPTLASTVCTNEPTVVIDKRDEKAYTIRRIGGTSTTPGDCWMVENLTFTGTELDSTTSNVSPEYTPQNPYRVNNGNGYYDLVDDYGTGRKCAYAGADVGGYSNACIKEGSMDITRTPIENPVATTTAQTTWYNYAAASAGSITGGYNSDPQLYDICPAGWRLPARNEANALVGHESEFNPTKGGYYYGGSLIDVNWSCWLTSTADENDDRTRYCLAYPNTASGHTGEVWPDRPGWRYGGLSIRCILKQSNINNLTYMQDFATLNKANNSAKKSSVLESMEPDTSYTLKDNRDKKDYFVSKLKTGCNITGAIHGSDSNCYQVWMTQNLDLNLETTPTNVAALTNKNTDLNTITSYTPSSSTVGTTSATVVTDFTSEADARYNHNLDFAPNWVDTATAPMSADAGDRYVLPTILSSPNTNFWDNGDKIYNSLAACQSVSSACDKHYSVGNYYNYIAAVASNSAVADSSEMPNSICPAGWRLPRITTAENNDYYGLTNAYSINASNYNPTGLNKIRQAPIYFNRPGYLLSSYLGCAGVNANYWFSNTSTSNSARYIGFYGTAFYGYHGEEATNQSVGTNIRCIAR